MFVILCVYKVLSSSRISLGFPTPLFSIKQMTKKLCRHNYLPTEIIRIYRIVSLFIGFLLVPIIEKNELLNEIMAS